ncbi:hypothetical protein E3N88_42951 [Mikania micrantha]|uniref:N-acetylglucosaminylphosphatidylinositol deacetylase n=1 Tax=Mikania micrantha TaxID=192012 RepID=A0A5N6LGA9_9ASTR|nr:hypothetical protein E3N88_42951 [Mikania micrantha]
MDHPDLQDGFGKIWNTNLLSKIVEKKIHDDEIDIIITFDNYGVSNHCNHRDVHHGVRRFMLDSTQRDIEAWELVSTNIIRKYIGPIDIWFSSWSSKNSLNGQMHCLLNENPLRSYAAMSQHLSQWVCLESGVVFNLCTYLYSTKETIVEEAQLPPMAKVSSTSSTAETSTKTAHRKMESRPRSMVTVRGISAVKRTKVVGAAKKKSSKLDANKPKKPPTAFFYFLEDFRKEFQEQNPDIKSMREIGKACGEKWKIMTYEEKVQYYDVATEKRAKFEKALADYVKKKENREYEELDSDPEYDD